MARLRIGRLAVATTVLLFAAMGLAACSSRKAQPETDQPDQFRAHAERVVAAWESAGHTDSWRHGYLPLELPASVPYGFAATASQREMMAEGLYRQEVALPTGVPPSGRVRFPDGSTMTVPLITAGAAFAHFGRDVTGPPPTPTSPPPIGAPSAPPAANVCPGPCAPLAITAVRLGTGAVRTSRGEATAPAWIFTVDGLSFPVTVAAVAQTATSNPPMLGTSFGDVHGVDRARDIRNIDGRSLTYTVLTGGCERDWKPLVYETARTIALGGSVQINEPPHETCSDAGIAHTFTVTLAAPVGDRDVIDGTTGTPLMLNLSPMPA